MRNGLLAEKRTHLAEKRTELSYERTIMAYVRTSLTVILFGIAFIGLAKDKFFLYSGISAILVGLLIMAVAFLRAVKHSAEMRKLKEFFSKVKYKFRKE